MVFQAGQSTLDLGCVRSGPGLAGSHMFTAAGRVCYRLVQRHSASHALTQHVLSDFKRNRERLPVLADSVSDDLDTSVAKVAWLCSPLRLTENTAVIARRRLCSSCRRARLLPAVYRILTFGVTRLDRTVSPHRTFIYCAVAHSATMSDTCMLKRAATPAVPVYRRRLISKLTAEHGTCCSLCSNFTAPCILFHCSMITQAGSDRATVGGDLNTMPSQHIG